MQKITPFLWFNTEAEEAAKLYVEIFSKAPNAQGSKIILTTRYNESGAKTAGLKEGMVMTVAFTLNGQEFLALNGGPQFSFSGAVSFVVNCKNQEEVDYFWERLSKGGKTLNCGWLNDKFGLSWQITPVVLGRLLGDKDEDKAGRVMDAMLKMDKIEIDVLERAYNQK